MLFPAQTAARNLVLTLLGMIWFLSVIFIGSLFLFLLFINNMFTVLLVEKVSPLSGAYAFNLLVTACSALAVTLCFFIVIYIARSSAKSDLSTPFSSSPRMALIATRKRVIICIPHCEIRMSVCLFCEVHPPTLTFIHLLIIFSDEFHNSLV